MAKSFLSTANTIFSPSSPSSSSSTTATKSLLPIIQTYNVKKPISLLVNRCLETSSLTKRRLAINLTTTLTLSIAGNGFFESNAAILEADDDAELMEKVKMDKKKRIERQQLISSSPTETAYLQELVYKLGKVGDAIQDNKLSVASSVLGPNANADWIQKANKAFTKLSLGSEETTEIDTLNSSLASLIASVSRRDIRSSKTAFVSSVVALEKWTTLTGLAGQLKGL